MPIYSYQCDNCGVRFERTQRFTDRPITRCPECRKHKVRKLLATPGIVFKGSGWYATDHRSSSGGISRPKKATEEKGRTDAKPAEKSSETTETKSSGDESK